MGDDVQFHEQLVIKWRPPMWNEVSADPDGTAEKEFLNVKSGQSQYSGKGFELMPQPHEHNEATR
jgi:hypothetical protein